MLPSPAASPFPVTSATPLPPATRLRLRRETIVIGGLGSIAAIVAAGFILATGSDRPTSAGAPTAAAAPEGIVVADEGAAGSIFSLTESQDLVVEAADLMSQGRWEEAADRLATVPSEYRVQLGIPALEADLETRRTTQADLRARLVAAVEAQRWSDAGPLLDELAQIAPLDDDLRAIQAQAEGELAMAAGGGVETAATIAGAGAPATASGATTAKPVTDAPAPAPAAAAPAPATGAGTAVAPATAGAAASTGTAGAAAIASVDIDSIIAGLGVELTPAQRRQLEAAVQQVLASQDVARLETALQGVLGSAEIADLQSVVGATIQAQAG